MFFGFGLREPDLRCIDAGAHHHLQAVIVERLPGLGSIEGEGLVDLGSLLDERERPGIIESKESWNLGIFSQHGLAERNNS